MTPHLTATSDVQLVRWPDDAARRDELAARGVPRLLLVEAGTTPPPSIDVEEDWIRVPADERDLWARLQRLALRHRKRQDEPHVDGEGVLRYRRRTVALAGDDARVAALLVADFGRLVRWDDLAATRPAAAAGVARLRRRIAGVGLVVHTVRGHGVVLDHGDGPPDDDTHATDHTNESQDAPSPGAVPTEDATWPTW